MSEEKEIRGKLVYEQDSKRFHRFRIVTDTDGAVTGSVYVAKKSELPDKLVLERKS